MLITITCESPTLTHFLLMFLFLIVKANVASKRSSTITTASDIAKVSEADKNEQAVTLETPVVPDATESPPDLSRKPAILGNVGTIARVQFSTRAKPTIDVEIPKKKSK